MVDEQITNDSNNDNEALVIFTGLIKISETYLNYDKDLILKQ